MALSADSICSGGSGDSGGTALSDLNLVSGLPITDHPTPIIEKLIAWTSKKIDSCNVDLAAVNELRYMLRICQEELDGRDDARTGEVIKASHSSSLAEYKVSKEVGLNSATAHVGSPEKSEGKTNAAFSEELSSLKLVKSRRSGDNARQLQSKSCISATKSCVPSKVRPSVRYPKKDSQTLLNRKRDFGLTGSSSLVSKRRAYGYCHHSRNSTFNKGDKTAAFLKLRRWWKGVDLFRKTYVFLPIYGRAHWSLAIICIPAKEDESGPIVLHLDSLQVHSSGHILQTLSKFLLQEWNYVKENNCIQDLPFSKNVWETLPWRIERETIMVPQQQNAYDCGLFVLYFMQRFLEEAPQRLRSQDLSMFGKRWFLPEEASSLRDKVRETLVCEFEKNRLSDSSDDYCWLKNFDI